jgi:CRP/FNR family transcriptional regulator
VTATDILAQTRFFAAVKGEARQKLDQMATLRRFSAGQTIFRQGDECPGVYIVGQGLVRVFKMSPAGKEQILHLVTDGQTFAEVATIGGFDCPAFAEAIEDTTCALLPAGPFRRAIQEDHQLCLHLLASLSGWVKHLVDLLEDITLRDAAGRVARFLLSLQDSGQGAVELPSLKKHMAAHLNLTSETLSRVLRRLSDAGLILTSPGILQVINRQSLADMAEGQYPQI